MANNNRNYNSEFLFSFSVFEIMVFRLLGITRTVNLWNCLSLFKKFVIKIF